MEQLDLLYGALSAYFKNDIALSFMTIFNVLSFAIVLSFYEHMVYKKLSHRAFYSRAFHTGIAVIPILISTIILCLQSNLIITLGTIGALAIIRFRTAVKDPIDMLYILWAIHIGICCGCQLYALAIITSIIVTLVLFCMDNFILPETPYTLVINCNKDSEENILKNIKELTKKMRIKSKNYTKNGLNMVLELYTPDTNILCDKLSGNNEIERFSIIKYDYEDII